MINYKRMRQFLRSSFFKHTATLLTANSLSQAIALLAYPLLTRIYAPDDFGLFNLFLSIGGILAIIGTGNYHYAIVLPKVETKALACVKLSFILNLIVVGISSFFLLFSSQIGKLFNSESLGEYLYLLPIFVLLTATWNILNYWFTRHQCYKPIAFYQISNSLGSSILKYMLGIMGFLRGGLLIGTILAQVIAFAGGFLVAWKKGLSRTLHIQRQEIVEMATTHKNFPFYSLPHSLINTLGGSLPIIFLAPFFSLAEIGFFGMALTLAFRPINIISSSLHQVFYPITTQKVNDNDSIMPFFKRYFLRTFTLLIPLFGVLFFFLPMLTEWLLGNGWHQSGKYIQLMLPWLALSAAVAPITYLADIFSQQRIALLLEILSFIVRFCALMIGIWQQNFYLAIAYYCVASALIILVQLLWYWHLVKQYEIKRI